MTERPGPAPDDYDLPGDAPDDGGGRAPLPDGVVPLREANLRDGTAAPGGCGLTGCLYGMVVLFALLLAAVVYIALTREWTTPAVMP